MFPLIKWSNILELRQCADVDEIESEKEKKQSKQISKGKNVVCIKTKLDSKIPAENQRADSDTRSKKE